MIEVRAIFYHPQRRGPHVWRVVRRTIGVYTVRTFVDRDGRATGTVWTREGV